MRHPGSASLHRFNEARFERQVDAALSVVKTILHTTRNPRHAAEEDHEYSDKYGLAEFLTNTGVAATLNVLEGLGLDEAKLHELYKFVSVDKRSATLRFEAEETCEFVQEKVVKVEGKHHSVTEVEESKKKGGVAAKETKTTTTHKVVTKVTEYHWRVGLEYVIYAFAGSDPQAQAVVLQRRSSYANVITTGNKESPLPSKARSTPVDTPITWLLENISPDGKCGFHIDRSVETCRTPRRNQDIARALASFHGMRDWGEKVRECLVRDIEGKIILGMKKGNDLPSVEPEARVHLHSITGEGVFVPVLPLFENIESAAAEREAGTGSESDPRSPALVSLPGWEKSPLLSVADVNLFLDEQRRSLDEKVHKINEFFPSKDGHDMISAAEGIIVLLALHIQDIANHFADGVDYVENMLKTQLIKAIGKEVQASDFAEYIRFHDQKLPKSEYAPEPFSYAIRRPNHYPDGVLSIEKRNGDSNDPIMSITRKLEGEMPPMFFPINAATSVEFTGDRYLHAWVSHRFAGRQEDSYQLVARARQFSSFLLLIGKISGPDGFEPQDAIILQNKDEVLVPLLLNQLPSPKDFKDAISSLSPEQKRFATAFRNMQLESSVFAVCCIQLKPQLEALLGLPSDALTKEIKLTQDLLSLFIDYQIPSDLLNFDGATDISLADKVATVKGHVESVLKVIKDVKDKELESAQQEADMAVEHHAYMEAPLFFGGAHFGAAAPGGGTDGFHSSSSDEADMAFEDFCAVPFGGAHFGAAAPGGGTDGFHSLHSSSGRRFIPPVEFHSSSSDVGLQAKYGHASAPRSGNVAPPPVSGGPPKSGGGPPEGRPLIVQQMAAAAAAAQMSQQQAAAQMGGGGGGMHPMAGGGGGGGPGGPPYGYHQQGRHMYPPGGPYGMPMPPGAPAPVMAKMDEVGEPSSFKVPSAPKKAEARKERGAAAPPEDAGLLDFTSIPKALDAKFEELDSDNALCATVIKTGDAWTKRSQRNILTKLETKAIRKDDRKSERDKAFDLLDALSRSGSLPVACAELHVIVAATHNFDRSLMETVIQDNVNPIEKMERSTLIIASTIHGKSPEEMLKDEAQASRVKLYSPGLFEA